MCSNVIQWKWCALDTYSFWSRIGKKWKSVERTKEEAQGEDGGVREGAKQTQGARHSATLRQRRKR